MIEINGEKHERIPPAEKTPYQGSRFFRQAIALAAMSGMISRPKEMPSVNIEQEFALIQQKKSNLSRSQRDWVVYQFNKQFKKVENE